MLTADTITDEQIRELHVLMKVGAVIVPAGFAIVHDAMCHTYRHRYCASDCQRRKSARARCAEILNARAKEAK